MTVEGTAEFWKPRPNRTPTPRTCSTARARSHRRPPARLGLHRAAGRQQRRAVATQLRPPQRPRIRRWDAVAVLR